MNKDSIVQCQPAKTPFTIWGTLIVAGIPIGGIIFIILFFITLKITDKDIVSLIMSILAIVAGAVTILLLTLFWRWDQKRWYWVLTEDQLIGGNNKDRIFPISKIDKIIPGLPVENNLFGKLGKLVEPHLWEAALTERQITLVLKFSDGSLMPFNVHRCIDGTTLMTKLIELLNDRIDHNYKFSRLEKKLLSITNFPHWNRVIKSKQLITKHST